MKSLSQNMRPESDENRQQPASSNSAPSVEPIETGNAENDEIIDRCLVHPPNPRMLDGMEKKRVCLSLANRCLMCLLGVAQNLTVKLRSLFNRLQGSRKAPKDCTPARFTDRKEHDGAVQLKYTDAGK